MEEEVRDILRNAVRSEGRARKAGLGTRIAHRFAGLQLPEILEWRGREARPARFGK
jgi:plasmid stability protein